MVRPIVSNVLALVVLFFTMANFGCKSTGNPSSNVQPLLALSGNDEENHKQISSLVPIGTQAEAVPDLIRQAAKSSRYAFSDDGFGEGKKGKYFFVRLSKKAADWDPFAVDEWTIIARIKDGQVYEIVVLDWLYGE